MQWLLRQRQNVGRRLRAYRRHKRVEVGGGYAGGKFPVPQRHVEGGVLAAHETGSANAVLTPEHKGKQQQRPTFGIIGDDDEGQEVLALPDLPLPGAEKIEPLIRRGELPRTFEATPDRFRLAEIVKDIDAGDAARLAPRFGIRSSVFDRGSHGHCETCLGGNI